MRNLKPLIVALFDPFKGTLKGTHFIGNCASSGLRSQGLSSTCRPVGSYPTPFLGYLLFDIADP